MILICPNCNDPETLVIWGSDLEQGRSCEECGYYEGNNFGIDFDDGSGLHWKLIPVQKVPE